MEKITQEYQFINSQTGNVIGYLSVSAILNEKDLRKQLEIKRAELATGNGLYVDLIFWQMPLQPAT